VFCGEALHLVGHWPDDLNQWLGLLVVVTRLEKAENEKPSQEHEDHRAECENVSAPDLHVFHSWLTRKSP
jgi:hypothetical protein